MLQNKDVSLIKVGIVGTGCIARGLVNLLSHRKDMQVTGMLTRRKGNIKELAKFKNLITLEPERMMEKSDVIVVSTGDPIYSTDIIDLAFTYELPVITMDADTQVVSGHWLSQRGFITESEGDQPGCLAALKEEVVQMGFEPVVYGNIKGFLNHNPSLQDMIFWAEKQGFSIHSVTSFTDGTKLQIEQCLVANGLGAKIAKQGLIGEKVSKLEDGAFSLAKEAENLNKVLSDYIISPESPPGVFIVTTHFENMAAGLETYKMGKGPYYLHYKPIHLCYFEIPKTIIRTVNSKRVLLDNGVQPSVSVGAVAKEIVNAGTKVEKGIGSREMRGEAINIADQLNHVPIGLMDNVIIKTNLEPGQIITFNDVDIPDSKALDAWRYTMKVFKENNVQIHV